MTTVQSCGVKFPTRFEKFPIFIFNDSVKGSAFWTEIFPEAIVVDNINELLTSIAIDVNNQGGLVIRGSTYSPLCRDSFLNVIVAAVNVCLSKELDGFYIDDYFNEFPLTTEISELSPRQVLQVASRPLIPFTQRSFWISTPAVKDGVIPVVLEAQTYPALVTVPKVPVAKELSFGIVILLAFLLIIGILFCLFVLVW